MNPQTMMQLMGAVSSFRREHPKFAQFTELMIRSGIPEGSVIEVTVTKPGEEPVTANMKVLPSDIELINALRNMKS
ncbi:MAG: hypothetical protein K6G58_09210 [Lachnospiraceae bacterium]|nr:hypothetical protein [Lachnospiraceae bacterium]